MQLSVIIVTYNSKDHIGDCLRTVKEQTKDLEYEVIVSDNASTDGTVELIESEFPWVTLVKNTTNLGFGTANNRGADIATGEVLFFLNDDTVQTGNALKQAYDKVMSDDTIGMLGFHLTYPDGSHQDSVRRFPQFMDQAMVLTKMHNFFPKMGAVKRYLALDFDYTIEQDVDQVMGACMLARKAVFDAVRGFDENFFIWFEEVDLQKRIMDELGLRIVYTPDIEMIHIKGATFGKELSLVNQRRLNNSMGYYFKKHNSVLARIGITLLRPYSIFLAALVQLLRNRGIHVKQYKRSQN